MRIQHNIMAMNAYRNYNTNTSALSKNLEKLSSGYKINRAGDDAAGLAISEKMRAQITGLEGAQQNAKDGISLVQTAEGALTEVHDMLNRMYSLAEQSANGTYDNENDRAQLQKEVDQLRTEINRISESANFNGIKLLDGNLAKGTNLAETTDITIADVGTTLGTNTILHENGKTATATSFSVDLNDLKYEAANDTLTLNVGGSTLEITTTAGMDADAMAAAFVTASTGAGTADGGQFKINGQEFTVTDAGNGRLTFTQTAVPTKADEVVSVNSTVSFTVATGAGNAATINGTLDTNALQVGAYDAGTVASANQTVTLTGGVNGTVTAAFDGTINDSLIQGIVDDLKLTATGDVELKKIADGGTDDGKLGMYVGNTLIAVSAETVTAVSDGGTQDYTFTGKDAASTSLGKLTLTSGGGGTDTTDGTEFDTAVKVGDMKFTAGTNTTLTLSQGGDFADLKDALEAAGAGNGAITVEVNAAGDGFDLKVGNQVVASATSDGTDGNAKFTINGKEVLTLTTSAAIAAANAGETFDTGLTFGAAVNAGDIVGSYNVGTTNNVQGNVESAGTLASTTFTLDKDHITDGASITIGTETYIFKTDKNNTDLDPATNSKVIDLTDLDSTDADYLGSVAERLTKAAANNAAFSVGAQGTTGKITIVEKEGQTAIKADQLDSKDDIASWFKYQEAENISDGLTLQIGENSESYNKLQVEIKATDAESIGIGDIDIGSQTGAAAALKDIENAINYISDVRGTLGATQNRLDHTINNLSVMQENIQDAESTIRDTDVAEEMMSYTKNNILIQSAQAMLAQANQVPQGVLQLLG